MSRKALVFHLPGGSKFWHNHANILHTSQKKLMSPIAKRWPKLLYRPPFSMLRTARIKNIIGAPKEPSKWHFIIPELVGICGSDIGLALGKLDPDLPFSFPCVLGHEIYGRLHGGKKRVVVDPLLSCRVRGLKEGSWCRSCKAKRPEYCQNFDKGNLPPGMFIGLTRGLPGGCGSVMAAHESQIFEVPDNVSDRVAVLAEPFSIALHAVLQNRSSLRTKTLVIGGGMIAFATVAALRMIGYRGTIIQSVAEKYQEDVAMRFGADVTLRIDTPKHNIESACSIDRMNSTLGSIRSGGVDMAFDCIASEASINQALSLTRENGTVVLVGIQRSARISLSHIIARGKNVVGSFASGWDDYQGESRRTFDIALDLLAETTLPMEELVTHEFGLSDWRKAFDANIDRSKTKSVKTVINPRN